MKRRTESCLNGLPCPPDPQPMALYANGPRVDEMKSKANSINVSGVSSPAVCY